MNVKALAAVKAQADQMKVHTGANLTYEQYVNLLRLAAQQENALFKPKEVMLRQQVYN